MLMSCSNFKLIFIYSRDSLRAKPTLLVNSVCCPTTVNAPKDFLNQFDLLACYMNSSIWW